MTKNNGFKVAALAASIALAMGATSAMAADPAAGQLPGQGKVTAATAPTVSLNDTAHTLGIALGSNTVIDWGKGTATTDINSMGTAGFNIGKGATVTFSGGFAALNIDSTGNPSQIFGTLTNSATGGVYVANTNGIIVGATGVITAGTGVALMTNTLIDSATDFQGSGVLTNFQGAGGDITVLKGAKSTGTLLISGGGTVNVDLTDLGAATTTINAGVKGGTLVGTADNKSASANITGDGTLAALGSAGTATTSGTLTLSANNVTGVLTNTNTGVLTLPATNGGVINNGTLTEAGATGYTSLTNNGVYTAGGATTVTGGDLVNNGTYNAGSHGINVVGGNLTNNASVDAAGAVLVTNGTITNNASLAGVTSLDTASDAAAKGFAAAGQYFITNAGTIASDGSGTLTIGANVTRAGTTNDTTGSFANTGTLQLEIADNLDIAAWNNLDLGGTLKINTTAAPTVYKAVSLTNPLNGDVTLYAGGYDDVADSFATAGGLTVATPVVFAGGGTLAAAGSQVKFMDNVSGVTSATDKTVDGEIDVTAGPALADDYAVRVAAGKTVSADTVYVGGDTDGDDHPNVILQGTVSGNDVEFGYNGISGNYQAISDLFSGPAGGIVGVGSNPYVEVSFTGAVKTAKYLNNANNFRYNYFPITNSGTGQLDLELDPFAYNTNGTSNGKSAVNVLVDGDVYLYSPWFTGGGAPAPTVIDGTGTAVTGVSNVPNTHLVLQSTGNIEVQSSFYWPGYVYLGTIDSNTDGSPAPGTLSADNAITLDGDFSNVLPGDVAGASGIHFMTAKALDMAAPGVVTTNANALINFPTDLLTQNYAQGILTSPTFSGGTAAGLVVTYGTLDPSFFHTHPVDSSK